MAEARVVFGRNGSGVMGWRCSDIADAATCAQWEASQPGSDEVSGWVFSDAVFLNSGSIPPGIIRVVEGTQQIVSPWGEQINTAVLNRTDGTVDLVFRMWAMPLEICTRIAAATADGKSLLGDGMTAINVIGGLPTASSRPPVSPSDAARLCSLSDRSNPVTDPLRVSIGFRLF